MLTVGDCIAFDVRHEDGVFRVTVRHGSHEGYGAAPDTGSGADQAFSRAIRDLNRQVSKADAAAYQAEWAVVTDRSPHDVYVPDALRTSEQPTGRDLCWDGGSHSAARIGVWKGRCIRCGNTV